MIKQRRITHIFYMIGFFVAVVFYNNLSQAMLTPEQEELKEAVEIIKASHKRAQKIAMSGSGSLDDTEQPIIINDHTISVALAKWESCPGCLQMLSKMTNNLTKEAVVFDLSPAIELQNGVIRRLSTEKRELKEQIQKGLQEKIKLQKEMQKVLQERAKDIMVQTFSSSDKTSSAENIPQKTENSERKILNQEDVVPTCWHLLQTILKEMCGYGAVEVYYEDPAIFHNIGNVPHVLDKSAF